MNSEKSIVSGYDANRASNYDDESKLDKGNREQHKLYLYDLLAYVNNKPASFLELGCGTAYFTDVFFDLYPQIKGCLIDGSQEMLDVAATRFISHDVSAHYKQALLEDIDWETMDATYDIIFSALCVHHLTDESKWKLFDNIYSRLSPKGVFILYDVFRPEDNKSKEILEYLACMDSRRRLMEELEVEVDIEELDISNIIANDRRIKDAEGDKEASLTDQVNNLSKSGFKNITTIFQDARFAGTIAFKN